MLAALAARYTVVRDCFTQASAVLGFDLWALVSEGPEDRLNRTEFTQPAMLTAGVATWRIWQEQGGAVPSVVSGHSLGEFTALVCAEALPFESAVQLVRRRGQLMQQAVPEGQGAMAAILGLADADIEAVCTQAAAQLADSPVASGNAVVEAVNYNSPGQVVIAGHRAAVERAVEMARERGAKRAVTLPVSVPAHSSLMRQAAGQFEHSLAQLPLSAPRCQYLSAVDARPHSDPADIRATLVRQLASPVRWTQTIQALSALTPTLIECGPGKVLTALNRRIAREAHCLALEDPDSLAIALQATGTAARQTAHV
jgi:[acyl-carrier-protein] S-malonyltransferase